MKLKLVTGIFIVLFCAFVIFSLVSGIWLYKPKAMNSPKSKTLIRTKQRYKDGNFIGQVASNMYGPVQVEATIKDGRIIYVSFLEMPSASVVSQKITAKVEPLLQQETLKSQSAQVSVVSRATYDSNSYIQSLQSALDKAKNS